MRLALHYHVRTLPGGLKLVIAPEPKRHTAVLGVFARAGARYEAAAQVGISHFFEHMVFRGAGEYPDSYALNLAIEQVGGPLQAATCRDGTSYLLRLTPEGIGRALELLGTMFRAPRYAGLAAERAIVLEELQAELDEDGREVNVENLSHRLLYPRHPLGRRILGEARSIRRFAVRDLEACREQFYVGANLVVVASGALPPEAEVAAAVAAHLGPLPAGEPARSRVPGLGDPRPRVTLVDDDDPQTRLRLAFRALPEDDPGFPALLVLRRVLDDGVSCRLPNRICEDLGLAYEVSAELESYGDATHFALDLTAAADKMVTAVQELLGVLESLTRDPPSPAELDKAVQRHRWDLAALLDDPWEVVQYLGLATLVRGVPEDPEELAARVAAVTAAQLAEVARRVFHPARLRAVLVGRPTARVRKASRRLIEGWRGLP